MEQIAAFALGVFIVTLVLGFVSMFRVSKTAKTNQASIDSLNNELHEIRNWATDNYRDLQKVIEDVLRQVYTESDSLTRAIDSRVDKLDTRLQHQLDDLARELDTCMNTEKISK